MPYKLNVSRERPSANDVKDEIQDRQQSNRPRSFLHFYTTGDYKERFCFKGTLFTDVSLVLPLHQLARTLMYSSQTIIWICSGCKIPKETEFPTEFSLQPNAKCSGFGLEVGMREGGAGLRKAD